MPSYINIQNNLSASLNLSTNVNPTLDSQYWGIDANVAIFGQQTRIAWLNRNVGIKSGKTWVFTTTLSIGGTTVQLQESLTGTTFSSDISVQIVADNQNTGWQANNTELTFTAADGNGYRITATYKLNGTYDDVTYGITLVTSSRILTQIEHVVVLMNENRSLDNLLGWVYASGTQPSQFLPAGSPQSFDGLVENTYYNTNPSVKNNNPVYASEGTTAWNEGGSKSVSEWCVPSPDPGEEFDHVTTQIFNSTGTADMGGFLTDYLGQITAAKDSPASAEQIMQSYSPTQLPIISSLATSFAVSDAWFCSVPSQTWPNRGFVQTGSSDGHTNNDDYLPWGNNTIFDVLSNQNIPWAVYNNGVLQSLTKTMFMFKYETNETNFLGIDDFQTACAQPANAPANLKLPAFSFVEPDFGALPGSTDESYHPPHDVRPGEQFLAKIYNAIAASPYRDNILFIVLFDEHGGTYDHVNPPTGAQPPSPYPKATDGSGFTFNRFGVRVPAIVISSWVQPGTVFRSNTSVPLDHTSVLATLRDWLGLSNAFVSLLPSPRISAAPNLGFVLTETTPQPWPSLPMPNLAATPIPEPPDDMPLNDVQRAILLAAAKLTVGRSYTQDEISATYAQLQTHGDARAFAKQLEPHLPLK